LRRGGHVQCCGCSAGGEILIQPITGTSDSGFPGKEGAAGQRARHRGAKTSKSSTSLAYDECVSNCPSRQIIEEATAHRKRLDRTNRSDGQGWDACENSRCCYSDAESPSPFPPLPEADTRHEKNQAFQCEGVTKRVRYVRYRAIFAAERDWTPGPPEIMNEAANERVDPKQHFDSCGDQGASTASHSGLRQFRLPSLGVITFRAAAGTLASIINVCGGHQGENVVGTAPMYVLLSRPAQTIFNTRTKTSRRKLFDCRAR